MSGEEVVCAGGHVFGGKVLFVLAFVCRVRACLLLGSVSMMCYSYF